MIKKIFQFQTDKTRSFQNIEFLRFYAISLVLLGHASNSLSRFYGPEHLRDEFMAIHKTYFFFGDYGVQVFFVISGFVLAFGLGKYYLTTSQFPSYKQYLKKRLIRLEIPYLFSLILMASIYTLITTIPLEYLWKGVLKSAFYINFLWKSYIPNIVTWSLEVEIQFYLIIPIILRIFMLKNSFVRYGAYILIQILCSFIVFNYSIEKTLLNYSQYFLIGIVLADFKLLSPQLFDSKKSFWDLIHILSHITLFFAVMNTYIGKEIIEPIILFFMIFSSFKLSSLNKFLENKFFVTLGGMCYSIYLWNYFVIQIAGLTLPKFDFSSYGIWTHILFFVILFYTLALGIGIFFYQTIEFPLLKKSKEIKY